MAVAHLLTDPDDGVGGDVGRRPRGLDPGAAVEEALQHVLAVGGVADLGMELHTVEAPGRVLEGGDLEVGGRGTDPETLRRSDDRVPVRHPDVVGARQLSEQDRVAARGRLRATELGPVGPLDRAPQGFGHGLEAVADAEDGHAGPEELGVDHRGAGGVDTRRPPRQDDGGRLLGQQLRHRHGVGHDLAVDLGLADPAGDQLRVLGAEVHHEDALSGGGRHQLPRRARPSGRHGRWSATRQLVHSAVLHACNSESRVRDRP